MARKYCEAISELEVSLLKNPSNKSIRKKLIICYVKTGKIYAALDLFEQLITEDAPFIINTDSILDDCPCPEIIYELENSIFYENEIEKEIGLGILWLYCDQKQSINHFSSLSHFDKRFETILQVLNECQQPIKR